jgi:hypothetical protein
MSGYIFTATGAEALAVFEDERVRYAASMDDGTGFVAFDGEPNYQLEALGRVLMMEPHPDYPDSWPKHFAPKRRVSNGMERFAIVSDLLADDIMRDPYSSNHVTGVALFHDGTVLLETDGFKVPMAIWAATPKVIADKRLLVPSV